MKLPILFLLLSFVGFAQQQDSLLYQINSISNDTERVNQLYQNGFDLRNTDPGLSYQLAKICVREALKCKSDKHIAKSYNLLGVLYYKKGDYNKALQFQKKSLELNSKIANEAGIAINQTNLGNIYIEVNSLDLAEVSYLKALQAYNKLSNTLQITKCLINIGVLKYEQKHLAAAIMQFKEALNYAAEIKDYDLMATSKNNLGTIFREQNKLDSSMIYLEEAIKLRKLIDNGLELADSYNNIALVFIKQKNYKDAEQYIHLTDSIYLAYNYPEGKVELYDTKSQFYASQQKFEEALNWAKKHYELKDSLKNFTLTEFDSDEDDALNTEHSFPESKSTFNNLWMLILLMISVIAIPLFLIRYKR